MLAQYHEYANAVDPFLCCRLLCIGGETRPCPSKLVSEIFIGIGTEGLLLFHFTRVFSSTDIFTRDEENLDKRRSTTLTDGYIDYRTNSNFEILVVIKIEHFFLLIEMTYWGELYIYYYQLHRLSDRGQLIIISCNFLRFYANPHLYNWFDCISSSNITWWF